MIRQILSRPSHCAVLALSLMVGGATGASGQDWPLTSLEPCVLAASPTQEGLCEPQIVTFAFEGAKATDPMDATAPHRFMVGSSALMPFLTTGDTTIAGWPLDTESDPVSTGSISGSQD